jgi:hypothetical protein
MIRPNILHSTIEHLPILDVIDAHQLADLAIDGVISELMRAPNTSRSYLEWVLVLADVRARIAQQISRRTCGRVHIDDVLHAFEMTGIMVTSEWEDDDA